LLHTPIPPIFMKFLVLDLGTYYFIFLLKFFPSIYQILSMSEWEMIILLAEKEVFLLLFDLVFLIDMMVNIVPEIIHSLLICNHPSF
jgi:uncharacterized membrane protein